MITVKSLAALIAAGVLSGCAGGSTKPPELLAAQHAYARAQGSVAGRLAQADLQTARDALDRAERSFIDYGATPRTRDLGYVAERRAMIAEAHGATLAAAEVAHAASERAAACPPQQMQQGQVSQEQLEQERAAREEAERRTQEVLDRLLAIEGARREPRGVVITLSGAVIFPFGKSTLLPIAQQRLSEVATVPGKLSSTVGSEAWNSRDLKSRPH